MEFSPDNTQVVQKMVATCPACGLLCDDVSLEIRQSDIKVLNTNCLKSIRFFTQGLTTQSPQIHGKPATLAQAVSHAAGLLKSSQKPLFAGLSTDVQGFRGIYSLASKTNGRLQHINSKSMARNMAVLQSTGWQTTTLTEVKNRADVIICIGTDIVSHNARFFERFIWLSQPNTSAMFTDTTQREVIYIGENLHTKAGISPNGRQPTSIHCAKSALPEIVAVLRALIAGKPLKAQTVAGVEMRDLITLADKLKQAQYAVFAWVAKDLDYQHAELTIQSVTKTVALLNSQTTRAAGLSLGGSDGDTSANNANTWLSGFSLKDGHTDHDALIWVNSFNANHLPAKTDFPLIVLGNANTAFEQTPDVFIPVSTPGLDCSGTLFRVDSAVSLPLKKVRENALLTLSEITRQIESLLG